jgi:AcrR family transcriptional regulator
LTGPPRRLRADARRNRARLLAEADAAFREHGADAALEGIARRAGVAIGTLYGHFPNRHALVGALLRDRHDTLFAGGDELRTAADPGQALRTWVDAVVEHAATYGGLADLFAAGAADADSELHVDCARMAAIGAALLERARDAGAVRGDVRGEDVFVLMNAAAWARTALSAEQAGRLVGITLAGMAGPAGPGTPRPSWSDPG